MVAGGERARRRPELRGEPTCRWIRVGTLGNRVSSARHGWLGMHL